MAPSKNPTLTKPGFLYRYNPLPVQTDLPIYALREKLRETWTQHNALVLVAPTGSGKTTQVCQMLLQDGAANDKRIVVLQPRRVAARSVARRVAEEMGCELGAAVGYQVRFDERLSDATRIAFVTEGILLRWLQSDPTLSGVGAVLFDEFHERNVMSDVALALCKRLQHERRPDLKLIVMSATLEAQPVADYLATCAPCPTLVSEGRGHPVDIHHAEWEDDGPVWERAAAKTVELLRSTDAGDVLVFMPGLFEIQRTMDEIRRRWREHGKGEMPALLALHGEMPPREQDRAFAPHDGRRVIVATNVAETSITLPDIHFVVDSGQARIDRYDPERGVNTLHIEPVSQASADQRAGRAGRVAPGQCFRLWSRRQHDQRPLKNTPEVQRTDLSSTLLLLHALGVDDVEHFDFLEKPEASRLRAASDLLQMLGAMADHRITEVGRRMARIPAHPRFARMLIEAGRHNAVREVALMAALVSGRDVLVRLNREDRIQKRNRESLMKQGQHTSDFFLLANAFAFAAQNHFDGKTCAMHGIHAQSAREVAQAYAQLLDVCEQVGLLDANAQGEPAPDAMQRCHLAGFIDHLAVRTSSGSDEYDLAGGRRCTLMDESVAGRHLLIVASVIREITTRKGDTLALLGYASAVQPAWIRAMNPAGLSETVEHVYDRLHKRVVAGSVLRFRDLVIAGGRVDEVDPAIAATVLADEIAHQMNRLPQWAQLKPWLAQHPLTEAQIKAALVVALQGATTYEEAIKRDVLGVFTREGRREE
jgi:ATP-dependent helicase HrpB